MGNGDTNTVLVVASAVVLVLGLLSRVLRRNALSPVLLALAAGALVGPDVLGWVDLTAHVPRATLLHDVAGVALALAVADIGLGTTRDDLRANARRLALLLTAGMVGMWLAATAGAVLLLGLPLSVALLLGAILTPTDPGVASGLVTGPLPERTLPRELRRTLQLESGANDGLALPFVLLAGLLATHAAGTAWSRWLVEAGREIGVALVLGPAIGATVGMLARQAHRHVAIAESFLPLVGISSSLFCLGLARLAGGSGVLAAFLAGVALSLSLPDELREPVGHALSVAGKLAVVTVFAVFGTVLPWSGWVAMGWAAPVFAVWVLVMRRPPVVAAVLPLTATGPYSRAYLAWFGPVGVAAIYYLGYVGHYDLSRYDRVFAAGSLAICASVLAHTLTSTPAVHAFDRHTGKRERARAGERLP